MRYNAIIIGGGHNGLTAAAYLARAGRKVLVLERRHVVGGAAVTEEVFPGFHISVCSYVVSLLRPEIIRELDLPRHGLRSCRSTARSRRCPTADYLWRVDDHETTRREIARHSTRDAEAYDEVRRGDGRDGAVRQAHAGHDAARSDVAATRASSSSCALSPTGSGACPARTGGNQLQLMTMSAADFLDQWFETDILKATMSASGIIGTFLGVRSPGTAYVLLHHYMGEIDGAFRSWGFARGGTGAISKRHCRRGARGRRRDSDQRLRSPASASRTGAPSGSPWRTATSSMPTSCCRASIPI